MVAVFVYLIFHAAVTGKRILKKAPFVPVPIFPLRFKSEIGNRQSEILMGGFVRLTFRKLRFVLALAKVKVPGVRARRAHEVAPSARGAQAPMDIQ